MARKCRLLFFFLAYSLWIASAAAQERVTFLYPSPAGTWAVPMIAKEAKYFENEGLSVELVRVGGSTRIVAALMGGSAEMIHAGEPAVIPAVARGGDVVIIAAMSKVPQHQLIARPEIKDVKDLKGKTVGITSFGSSSDFILRFALEKNGLDAKDVSIVQTGGQPEGLAAMAAGKIYAQRMSFPFNLKALQLGMRQLVDFAALGLEENNGPVITTRSFVAQHRSTVMKFMRAFVRGMHRYKTDKEFSKKVLAKYAQIQDDKILEATWEEYARNIQRIPRPTLKGIQHEIESGMAGEKINLNPEKVVDFSIVDDLERSGFIDSVYRRK